MPTLEKSKLARTAPFSFRPLFFTPFLPHVDGGGDGYLRTVCDYVHLNPVRARLLKPEEPLQIYLWSSYPEYLKSTLMEEGVKPQQLP